MPTSACRLVQGRCLIRDLDRRPHRLSSQNQGQPGRFRHVFDRLAAAQQWLVGVVRDPPRRSVALLTGQERRRWGLADTVAAANHEVGHFLLL
jgi:hypothetical protein